MKIRQVSTTDTMHSDEFMPMAFIGTIFIATNESIAAMVVIPENITGQPVSVTASVMARRRSPC